MKDLEQMKTRRKFINETHYENYKLESALDLRSAQVVSKMGRSNNQTVEKAKER